MCNIDNYNILNCCCNQNEIAAATDENIFKIQNITEKAK